MRQSSALAALTGLFALAALAIAGPQSAAADAAKRAHEFAFPGIDGDTLSLDRYRGKPMLVVNTASRCGYTGQYSGLQKLWERYRDQGLVVIGAPSADFHQELDSRGAVKEFCETTFGIDFPMTDIVSVKGAAAHPFFAWAASESEAPSWNFNKYLIDAEGRMVRHYGSRAAPESIAADIEAVLAARK